MAVVEYNFDRICRSCLLESDSLRSILSANIVLSGDDENVALVRNVISTEDGTIKDFRINELVMECTQVKVSSIVSYQYMNTRLNMFPFP